MTAPYITIPHLVYNDDIRIERSTLIAIYASCGEDGVSFATPDNLAEMVGQSVFSVRRHMRKLEELGYISRWRIAGESGWRGSIWLTYDEYGVKREWE